MSVVVLDERLGFTTREACAAVGLTYQCVDRWVRGGWVWPSIPAHGQGTRRQWSTVDVERLARIARVVREAETAGFTPSYRTVGDMWDALESRTPWSITLTL
jgi:hypothetical protein